jgi:hypothetical protein
MEPSEDELERLRSSLHIPLYKHYDHTPSGSDNNDFMTYERATKYDNTYVQNPNYVPHTKSGKQPEARSRTLDLSSISGPLDVEDYLSRKGRTHIEVKPLPELTASTTTGEKKLRTSPFDCPKCPNVSLLFDPSDTIKIYKCPHDKDHCYYYCLMDDQLLEVNKKFIDSDLFEMCRQYYQTSTCLCKYPHDTPTAVTFIATHARLGTDV